jgi:hypothetical protein
MYVKDEFARSQRLELSNAKRTLPIMQRPKSVLASFGGTCYLPSKRGKHFSLSQI